MPTPSMDRNPVLGRRGQLAGALAVLAVAGLAVLVTAGDGAGQHQVTDPPTSKATSCPEGAKPLPADALAGATEAALDQAEQRYEGINTKGARAMKAARAVASNRGEQVERTCGKRARSRTVVIDLLFPRMLPSASLPQGVVFVARFEGGFRIWQVAH